MWIVRVDERRLGRVRSASKPASASPSSGSHGLPMTAVATTMPSASKATCVRLPFGSVTAQGCKHPVVVRRPDDVVERVFGAGDEQVVARRSRQRIVATVV